MLKAMIRLVPALTLTMVLGLAGSGTAAMAKAPAQQKPTYSYAEYNAYQAAAKETNPQQRVKLLDDFVSKFPKSTLLPFVYQAYYQTYDELKQYDKVIEYADKLITSNDKVVADGMKLQALLARERAFDFSPPDPKAADASQQFQTAQQYAQMGLGLLDKLAKPAAMTDQQFAEEKKGPTALFAYTEGYAALSLKDYPTAIKAFKLQLANDPTNAVAYFRLGVAYLEKASQEQAAAPAAAPAATPAASTTPATTSASSTAAPTAAPAAAPAQAPLPGPTPGQQDFLNGFWALARSVALGGPTKAQVQAYLQNQMLVYQKTACQDLLTGELNNLLQMAQTTETVDPPSGYTLPSGIQLTDYLQSNNLFTIMQDLQVGGDRATFVWLAVCGNEFPEVPVKVISVTPTDTGVDMMVYSGSSSKDLMQAKTANMEVKVDNEPDAQRVKKDDIVRFTGTVASFDPAPNFLLHWDKAQVNPADIPPGKPGRPVRHGRRL